MTISLMDDKKSASEKYKRILVFIDITYYILPLSTIKVIFYYDKNPFVYRHSVKLNYY
jgi:hypothetical protein